MTNQDIMIALILFVLLLICLSVLSVLYVSLRKDKVIDKPVQVIDKESIKEFVRVFNKNIYDTRSIKKLLILMKDTIKLFFKNTDYVDGLCLLPDALFLDGIINELECRALNAYLHANLSKDLKEDGYVWKAGLIKPRIVWLDEEIFKYKS